MPGNNDNDAAAVLRVAQRVACTAAEGPGRRYALWFQGCPLRCPECCNPEMLPFAGGELVAVEQIIVEVRDAAEKEGIEGITLLGGEPFAHVEGAAMLAGEVRQRGLSVMIFSGYTLEEIQASEDPHAEALLRQTDILVDGPYDKDQPDTQRRWIGSRNQRIHFLTERYHEAEACWRQPDTLEIRLCEGELTINGFPAASATGVWKKITRS